MAGEEQISYPVQVFADEAQTRLVVRVTNKGDVQLADDVKGRELFGAVTQLAKLVFKLRNDDAIRAEEEKMLDEQIGSRSKLRQEILRLKHELAEAKRGGAPS